MTTVLAVYNSEGCVGRCDARCHHAHGKSCTCICGGKNHGVGLEQAIQNNHERIGLTPEDLAAYAKAIDKPADSLVVIDRVEMPGKKHAAKAARRRLDNIGQGDVFPHG
jgi:hypothetical protein